MMPQHPKTDKPESSADLSFTDRVSASVRGMYDSAKERAQTIQDTQKKLDKANRELYFAETNNKTLRGDKKRLQAELAPYKKPASLSSYLPHILAVVFASATTSYFVWKNLDLKTAAQKAQAELETANTEARTSSETSTQQIEALNTQHESAMQQLRSELETAKTDANSASETSIQQIATLNAQHEAAMQQLRGELEQTKATVTEKAEALAAQKTEHGKAIEGLQAKHDEVLTVQKTAHDKAIQQSQGELEQTKATVTAKEEALTAQKTEHGNALEAQKAEHDKVIADLKAEHGKAIQTLQSELDQTKATVTEQEQVLAEQKSQHNKAMQTLTAELEVAKASQQSLSSPPPQPTETTPATTIDVQALQGSLSSPISNIKGTLSQILLPDQSQIYCAAIDKLVEVATEHPSEIAKALFELLRFRLESDEIFSAETLHFFQTNERGKAFCEWLLLGNNYQLIKAKINPTNTDNKNIYLYCLHVSSVFERTMHKQQSKEYYYFQYRALLAKSLRASVIEERELTLIDKWVENSKSVDTEQLEELFQTISQKIVEKKTVGQKTDEFETVFYKGLQYGGRYFHQNESLAQFFESAELTEESFSFESRGSADIPLFKRITKQPQSKLPSVAETAPTNAPGYKSD